MLAAALGGGTRVAPAPAKPTALYELTVDTMDLSRYRVRIQLPHASGAFRLAMPAHPEYNERYWRFVRNLTVTSPAGRPAVVREDSALWMVTGVGAQATVEYEIELPEEAGPRAAWRPFLSRTGGLLAGPYGLLYLVGQEESPVALTLRLPAGWHAATRLDPAATPGTFTAASAADLMNAPVLVGHFHSWNFMVDEVPFRVAYWPRSDAPAFDTASMVDGIRALAQEAVRMFRGAPWREYLFILQDGAYGALEHPNSLTLGLQSRELARDPHTGLEQLAHEFFHAWNLMRIRPAEYQGLTWRPQPPTRGLWWSEGLTLFYADLLLRRAGLPVEDSTRVAHLEQLIERYLFSPGHYLFSAESVSSVEYNTGPGALGDYTAGPHLQGEILGALLDIAVRAGSGGTESMDAVMRRMLAGYSGTRGFTGSDIEREVEAVCRCHVTPLFDQHVRSGGQPINFDRYLQPLGLRARVTWAPATRSGRPEVDLRIYGWEPTPGEGLRLIITSPASCWGRAGLHTGDRLVTINGRPVTTWPALRSILLRAAIGDSLRVAVERPTGAFTAVVEVQGFERPTVTIEERPDATREQRVLREAWEAGR